MTAAGAAQARPRRLVLVGASNLTVGIGTVLDTSAAIWKAPLDVLAAYGHGRSFGMTTTVCGRTLPGILECELWRQLGDTSQPPAALVTDIGNDILYEQPVERITGWVDECFARLAAARAQVIVTGLPVVNLETLSPRRFYFLRTLMFPGSRLTFEQANLRAHAVDAEVRRLSSAYGFRLVEPRRDWYGFDAIHIRFRRRPRAWREILHAWLDARPSAAPARRAWLRSWTLWLKRPHARRLLGMEQRGAQPALRARDGMTVSLY